MRNLSAERRAAAGAGERGESRTGLALSTGLHAAAIIGLALSGQLLSADDEGPQLVATVDLVSAASFDAMVSSAPEAALAEVPGLTPPDLAAAPAPDLSEPDEAPDRAEAAPAAEPPRSEAPETEPSAPPPAAPTPPTQTLTAPAAPEAPPTPPQGVTAQSLPLPAGPDRPDAPQRDAPIEAEVAAPRDLDRVAPRPVAPSPLVAEAPEALPDRSPDAERTVETPPEPEAPAAAPREATTQIVTEADDTSDRDLAAPVASALPVGRPEAPPPARQPEPEPEPREQVAAAQPEAPAAPAQPARTTPPAGGAAERGPPIPRGAIEGVRSRLESAWNVSILTGMENYDELVVTLQVPLGRDGRPAGDVRVIRPTGRLDGRWRRAVSIAERALLRAAGQGFQLPAESYGRWQTLEVTFNPGTGRLQVGGGS